MCNFIKKKKKNSDIAWQLHTLCTVDLTSQCQVARGWLSEYSLLAASEERFFTQHLEYTVPCPWITQEAKYG